MDQRCKIALVGDTHADERHRFDEHNRIMAWIANDAAQRGCGLMLHSGDVYERAATTPAERRAVADWCLHVTDTMPLVVVAGNHDNPLDIDALGRLRTDCMIRAISIPVVTTLTAGIQPVSIACLPWPRKAHLLADLPHVSREEGDQIGVNALRNVLRGLGRMADDAPRVFLGHVQVRASKVGISQPPLVGCDFELGIDDLALVGADFYALGHIHLGWPENQWEAMGAPVIYPGSPRRCNYGELEEKSYTVIEFDGPRLVGFERVPTPCAPMQHMEFVWEPEHGGLPAGFVPMTNHALEAKLGEVRVRYHVERSQREVARAAALEMRDQLLEEGAIAVKLEEQIEVESRARNPEVAAATTLAAKLEALWSSKQYDPGERREPLLDKLSTLEVAP